MWHIQELILVYLTVNTDLLCAISYRDSWVESEGISSLTLGYCTKVETCFSVSRSHACFSLADGGQETCFPGGLLAQLSILLPRTSLTHCLGWGLLPLMPRHTAPVAQTSGWVVCGLPLGPARGKPATSRHWLQSQPNPTPPQWVADKSVGRNLFHL